MKKMIACLLTFALALTAVCAMAEGSLTFSWWGGDARHEVLHRCPGQHPLLHQLAAGQCQSDDPKKDKPPQ